MCESPDIYFDDNYGKLYETVEGGKAEIFNYTSELGNVKNQFIKREIPIYIDDQIYYDIVTPYGYGGPVITNCHNGKKEKLIDEYIKAFTVYCKQNNIVSEFVRFHPIIENAKDFKDPYNISCIRETVGTNLKDYDNPTHDEFSKSRRKTIRKALKEGVAYEIIENPKDLSEFKEVYYSTMDRNKASGYYYFDEEYFNNALELFRNNIITVKATLEGKTISQGFYFVYGKYIHAHLSGTLNEYLRYNPAYILKYATALWGKEKGYELIHYGGGRSNSEDDNLYKFKKAFSKNTQFDFYVGKKIWNKEVYKILCKKVSVGGHLNFFPAYRAKM